MSKLLIDVPPLQVLPPLAEKIGLNEALALQQLHWLLNSRHPDVVHLEDGTWVRTTVHFWESQFPFWSERTIKRIWAHLRQRGLVSTKRGLQDSTYSIHYEALDLLLNGAGQDDPSAGQDDPNEGQVGPSAGQDDPYLLHSEVRRTTTERTTERTTEKDNVEKVADATSEAEEEEQDALFETPKVTPPSQPDPLVAAVQEVWDHHVALFDPKRPDLTDSRKRVIRAAFKEVMAGRDEPTRDDIDYLKRASDGLQVWRRNKPGDTAISAIFASYPGGKPLGDHIQFFVDQAESGGTSVSPKLPSVLSGTITGKKREVLEMLAYTNSPFHQERGQEALDWLKEVTGTEPIIEEGELRGWRNCAPEGEGS
jgi:hypothetical protein